jgi:hypothetical protein
VTVLFSWSEGRGVDALLPIRQVDCGLERDLVAGVPVDFLQAGPRPPGEGLAPLLGFMTLAPVLLDGGSLAVSSS